MDLFSYQPTPSYPHHAGSKESTTSLDAANAIEASGKAAKLRGEVLNWYLNGNVGTADEAAQGLGELPWSIRPRVSELFKQGLLAHTGIKRRALGGRPAHVLRAK